MPKVMCDWNGCRYNSNKNPDSGDPGECQFEGTIALVDQSDVDEDSKLSCEQFEWEAE
jgi:hypothetical protein